MIDAFEYHRRMIDDTRVEIRMVMVAGNLRDELHLTGNAARSKITRFMIAGAAGAAHRAGDALLVDALMKLNDAVTISYELETKGGGPT